MGRAGPTPSRSEERRRTNSPVPSKLDPLAAFQSGINMQPEPPAADPDWEPQIIDLYLSMAESPGVVYAYGVDWHLFWLICDQHDRNLKPVFVGFQDRWNTEANEMEHLPVMARQPIPGGVLTSILKGYGDLLVTEAARRRAGYEAPQIKPRVETLLGEADDGVVTDIRTARELGLTS